MEKTFGMAWMKGVLSSLLLCLLFCLLLLDGVQSRAVVGIDFGSTSVRMGMLRSGVGSVEIVLNLESDRKSVNAVGFRDESTLFSQTAMNMFSKLPKNVFYRLNTLLGKLYASDAVEQYRRMFPHELAEDPVRKTVLVGVPNGDKMVPVEQLVATLFVHLMELAQAHASIPVVDCVISIPVYYDHFERQAILDAAKIAGFKVLSLVNSVSAAALFKTAFGGDLAAPANFIIYDSGASGTSAALITVDPAKKVNGVTAKGVEIRATASDAGLGGDLIDDRITKHLIGVFETMHPGVTVPLGKPHNKALIEAMRIKKILNANEKVLASLDDLVDDYGLNTVVSRADVETLVEDLAARFRAPIDTLLHDTQLKMDQVTAILMIGGNSRNQYLLKMLKATYGDDKLSVTLDPDEAIVKGATLYAAKLHSAFSLRPLHFSDITPSGLHVQYRNAGVAETELKTVELVAANSPVPVKKSLFLKKMNAVDVDLFYSRMQQRIAAITIRDFDVALRALGDKKIISSKMRVPVGLSISGHVLLEAPVAVVEYEEEVSRNVYKTKTVEPAATAPTVDAKPADASPEDPSSPPPPPTTPETIVETEVVRETVKRTMTLDLTSETVLERPVMSDELIAQCHARIEGAREKEREKNAVANARNDVDKAVYRLQGDLTAPDFVAFSKDGERNALKTLLDKTSRALEGSQTGKTVETYVKMLEELKKAEAPILHRQAEANSRPEAIAALRQAVAAAIDYANTQKTAVVPSARAQTDAELSALHKKAQSVGKWLDDKAKKQGSQAKADDPVLLTKTLEEKREELTGEMETLQAKKLPPSTTTPVEAPTKTVDGESVATPQQDAAAQEQAPAEEKDVPPSEHDEL